MLYSSIEAFLALLPAVSLFSLTRQPSSIAQRPHLRLSANATFKLSIFSDLHYGENEDSFGIPQDINSTNLMTYVLAAENPDLVILNGDLITGENTFASNSSKYLDVLVKPLLEGNYKWASTYGNHDSKYNLSRHAILRQEEKYPLNSYTQHGPPETDGVTNYMLPIYPAHTSPAAPPVPVALLWFFDSRGGSTNDPTNTDNIPNWVSSKTATWFRTAAATAQREWGVLPSLAFVHIPPTAYLDLQRSARANASVSGSHYPGLNADIPLAAQGGGREALPFMRALLDTPGVHSVYVGHDHGDSWCGRWPGTTLPGRTASRPFLCFCKHSGFGGYGTWNRGVRQVKLAFDTDAGGMGVETWVRMQQGAVVTRVQLNATYGDDVYPIADGGYHRY